MSSVQVLTSLKRAPNLILKKLPRSAKIYRKRKESRDHRLKFNQIKFDQALNRNQQS